MDGNRKSARQRRNPHGAFVSRGAPVVKNRGSRVFLVDGEMPLTKKLHRPRVERPQDPASSKKAGEGSMPSRPPAETAEHHSTAPTRFQGSLNNARRWRGGGIAIYQKRPPHWSGPRSSRVGSSRRHQNNSPCRNAARQIPSSTHLPGGWLPWGQRATWSAALPWRGPTAASRGTMPTRRATGMAGHATRPMPSSPRARRKS